MELGNSFSTQGPLVSLFFNQCSLTDGVWSVFMDMNILACKSNIIMSSSNRVPALLELNIWGLLSSFLAQSVKFKHPTQQRRGSREAHRQQLKRLQHVKTSHLCCVQFLQNSSTFNVPCLFSKSFKPWFFPPQIHKLSRISRIPENRVYSDWACIPTDPKTVLTPPTDEDCVMWVKAPERVDLKGTVHLKFKNTYFSSYL